MLTHRKMLLIQTDFVSLTSRQIASCLDITFHIAERPVVETFLLLIRSNFWKTLQVSGTDPDLVNFWIHAKLKPNYCMQVDNYTYCWICSSCAPTCRVCVMDSKALQSSTNIKLQLATIIIYDPSLAKFSRNFSGSATRKSPQLVSLLQRMQLSRQEA